MFTVIIADEKNLQLFGDFDIFLAPLVNEDEVVFCKWNKQGRTLLEMLPDIYDKIQYHPEWRAIIINDDCINKLNPFDYVDYSEVPFVPSDKVDWNDISLKRQERLKIYDKAINNPLTRLTKALSNTPVNISDVHDKNAYEKLLSGELSFSKFMLIEYLGSVNTVTLAIKVAKYRKEQLYNVADPDVCDKLIEAIRSSDADAVFDLVAEDKVFDLVKILSENDPLYSDPECVEHMVENAYKFNLYASIADDFDFKDRAPTDVICISQRTIPQDVIFRNLQRKNDGGMPGTHFIEWNLYPESIKYLVFDIVPEDNKQFLFDRIRYTCFIMLLAKNSIPNGSMSSSGIYKALADFDNRAIEKICSNYLSKLKATRVHLKDSYLALNDPDTTPLDEKLFQKLFESDVTISIDSSEYSRKELYANSKGIGLSQDCPEDEYKLWAKQFDAIEKRFVKYLREPRRALKSSIRGEFHKKKSIEDDRALLMNENQIEDMQMRIVEEEEKMIETTTTHLFNTAKYKKELKEAGAEINQVIGQRMTRSKTIAVAGSVLLAYFIGFIPLIVRNAKVMESLFTAIAISGAGLLILSVVGFLFLFSLRGRLKDKFSHFNHVMSSVCDEVENGLRNFSTYLMHACNMMRASSVLSIKESSDVKKQRILSYHMIMVDKKIVEMNEMFSKYVDCESIVIGDAEPFDYDFSQLCDYDYKVNCAQIGKNVEFFQAGNFIASPVDYIDSIKLIKEELYE